MTKTTKILASALVAIAATGCAAPTTPVAAKAPPLASPQAAGVIGPLRSVLAVNGETLNDTAATGAKLMRQWGLGGGEARYREAGSYKVAEPVYREGDGRITHYNYQWKDLAAQWSVYYSYTGDGAITYLGESRYAYEAPADRMLYLNRVHGGFAINGVYYRGHYDMPDYSARQDGVELSTEIDVVVAPGDTVVFSIGSGSQISGYTCDPAKFNMGPTPGAAGAGGATAK